MFSGEFWKIFKNTFFIEHPRTTVSDHGLKTVLNVLK